MTAPSSTTYTVVSGDLSTLDRASAFGVETPVVICTTPALGKYNFIWDFDTIAIRPDSFVQELHWINYGGSAFSYTKFYGSNDGSTWILLTPTINWQGPIAQLWRNSWSFIPADNPVPGFYRYLKYELELISPTTPETLEFRFLVLQWQWSQSRPVSDDGHGGVGPGGDGGGGDDPGGANDPFYWAGIAPTDIGIYPGNELLKWFASDGDSSFIPPPSNVYLGLFVGDPFIGGIEVTPTRAEVTFTSVADKKIYSSNDVSFGTYTEDPDLTINYACLFDTDTGGTGKLLVRRQLIPPVTFHKNDEVKILAGNIFLDFSATDLSEYLGEALLNWFRGVLFPTATANTIAMFDGDPEDDVTPGTELTGTNGLTRPIAKFNDPPVDPVGRYALNNVQFDFGIPNVDVNVSHISIFDGLGNMLTNHALPSPAHFVSGSHIVIRRARFPLYY